MNNTISNNVVICPDIMGCAWVGNEWQSDNGLKEGGIYLLGMTNDLIGNRVIGMEHGMWSPGSAKGNGKGAATGKVCPEFSPFGVMRGNVYHDCQRFGIYLDHQYPRRLIRDENGYVVKDRFRNLEKIQFRPNYNFQPWKRTSLVSCRAATSLLRTGKTTE